MVERDEETWLVGSGGGVGVVDRCLRHRKQECFIDDYLLFGGSGSNRHQVPPPLLFFNGHTQSI